MRAAKDVVVHVEISQPDCTQVRPITILFYEVLPQICHKQARGNVHRTRCVTIEAAGARMGGKKGGHTNAQNPKTNENKRAWGFCPKGCLFEETDLQRLGTNRNQKP